MLKLTPSIESKLLKASQVSGKTPNAIMKNALDNYLEELEVIQIIKQRKNNKTISVAELGRRIGL